MTTESAMIADTTDATIKSVAPVVGGGELLGMGISMAIVVAAILILGWFYSRSRLAGSGHSDLINVVATRALGPKERLMVVEVADQQLLIGMTSTAVQTLHVFDTPLTIPETSAENSSFSARLMSAVKEIRK
jgi:flagellar protein FliO/FliZ